MADLQDYELLKPDQPDSPPRARSRVWIAVILLGVVAGSVGYFMYGRRPAPAPAATVKPVPQETPPRPLGGEPDRITVPPLDQSDGVVRDLVRRLTSHPTVLAWLATNGLIRNFTAVVSNVADGVTPARQLRALRPASPFRVVDRGGQRFIDPRSYDRYNAIADAVASIDPPGAARVYATLKPRIQQAYGDLGMPPDSFDRALERAIVSLLQVPAIDNPIRVESKGATNYRYADPQLEGLTAAQRHLLRTGPRNVRTIQAALRQLAIALGIPPGRLPAGR